MTAALLCLHARQSARLSFNAAGLLDAHMVCDICDQTLQHLPEQTADARCQQAAAVMPPPVIAAA